MAQRYGGEFSPDGPSGKPGKSAPVQERRSSYRNARRSRAGGRINMLFIAPLPMLAHVFGGGAVNMAASLGAMGLLLLAAYLTREGLIAHDAYDARKIARRPAFPRKLAGTVLTGLGLALAAFTIRGDAVEAALTGLIGSALHFAAFGPDPMKSKGVEGIDQFQTDRVARAVDEAEKHLAAMSDAMLRAKDRQMSQRLEQFQATARDLFRTIEDDPRDLTAARKYLSVYLMGARDATIKFADIYARSQDSQARADYAALLDDLEQNFAARTRKLLVEDRSDLTVEVEVLRERLAREGVRLEDG